MDIEPRTTLEDLCNELDIGDTYPKTVEVPVMVSELVVKDGKLFYLNQEIDIDKIQFESEKLKALINQRLTGIPDKKNYWSE